MKLTPPIEISTADRKQTVILDPKKYQTDSLFPVVRVEGLHSYLDRKRRISPEHYQWAEKYTKAQEILRGARDGRALIERGVDEAEGGSVFDTPTAAAQFVRFSDGRMTSDQRDVIMHACVWAHRIGDCAIVLRIYPGDDETMKQFEDRTRARVELAVRLAIYAGSGVPQTKDEQRTPKP
ncbi:MAG TPA: hypothetical protein PK677_11340 [Acidiphilium sp.]|nr:hypothetical protein [Acidiphilium sp.]